jgi:predicted permease
MRPTDHDDSDLQKEIRAHLELEAEERLSEGASPEEAHYAAQRAFGNVTRIREDARAVWVRPWVDQCRQDLRYAIRTLRRQPGFAAVAILTLALGIGANTAIFTVVLGVLVRPLPFAGSDRVVRVVEHVAPANGSSAARRTSPLALSDIAEFRSRATTLSHVGVSIPTIRTVTNRDEPIRLVGSRVSPDLLSMTGLRPLSGRLFDSHEDAPGAEPVVILSRATWQRYFGSNPDVIGQTVDLDGRAHTVVGVLDSARALPDPRDEFWIPFTTAGPMMRQRLPLTARLKEGISIAAAAEEIGALVPRIRPPDASSSRFEIVPLKDLVVAPVKPALLMLTGAVGLVLLIACVNVASLLLARSAARHRETAVRLALGAGRGRVVRQALTESMLLGLMGGAFGIGLALGGVRLLRSLAASLPRRDLPGGIGIPRLDEVSLDLSVLAFTVIISILTGMMFGLIPAIRQSRSQPIDALRLGASAIISGFNPFRRHRTLGVLVVAEIAMATMLFIGGALLIHSFFKLSHVNAGFDPRGVLTFQIALPPARPDEELRRIAQNSVERLQSLPGVHAVGYAETLPMTRVAMRFVQLGTAPAMMKRLPAPGSIPPDMPDTRLVSREYLRAMGIPIIAGRSFADGDRAGAPQVMLINRTLARSGFLGENPLGKRFYALGPDPWEVVGIVEDVRQASLEQAADPQIFMDYRQVPADEPQVGVGLYFGVRGEGDPSDLASSVRTIVTQVDQQVMLENIAPMQQLVASSLGRPRLYAVLLGVFACVAVALAAIGIYGVMTYSVAQRTREIGIRVALGAGRRQVMTLVMGQSLAVTVAGLLLGLGGAAALTRYLDQLLFGLSALDPATFATVAILFAAIAMAAAFFPARRATRVDPLIALRTE